MSQNNNATRILAEQIGFLFLQNIEQAEMISKLKEEVNRLENEKKAFQESNKYD